MGGRVIALLGVSKRYGKRAVLRGIDLDVTAGERVALVGTNGSGKTTLLRGILGLVRVEGTVRVAGIDPWTHHAEAQASIAWVPQRAPALTARVGELAAAWSRMRSIPVEVLVVTADRFGLDVRGIADRRFDALSGGMQQKLLAAMALATPCPILAFDEPTANLDAHARAVFLKQLEARGGGVTLVLSSHRMDEVRQLVDRVVVVDEGAIRGDAPLAAFLADADLARATGMVDPLGDPS